MKAFLPLMFTCLVFPVLQSCQEREAPDVPCSPEKTVFIPAILKDYFHFKEGSWWVYAYEHDSTIIDSFWVHTSSNSFDNNIVKHHDYSKPYCYEDCDFTLQHGSTIDKGFYSSTGVKNSRSNTPQTSFFNVIDMEINGNTQYRVTYYPDSGFAKEGPAGNFTDLVKDTVLFGTLYPEVIRCYYAGNPKQVDPYTEVLYARNIGKIQYTKQNGTTWYLVRYKIDR